MKTRKEFQAALRELAKEAQASGFSLVIGVAYKNNDFDTAVAGRSLPLHGLVGTLSAHVTNTVAATYTK